LKKPPRAVHTSIGPNILDIKGICEGLDELQDMQKPPKWGIVSKIPFLDSPWCEAVWAPQFLYHASEKPLTYIHIIVFPFFILED
jgi:hypothetical protein